MRYTLLAFLSFITVIAYVQRSAMNGATTAIENDLHITSRDLGWVMSGWYLLYSLFQLPGGWVADRLGSKPALVIFATMWSLLTGLAGLAAGPLGLLLLWALMGGAQAGIFPVLHQGHWGHVPEDPASVRLRCAGVLYEPRRRSGARNHQPIARAAVLAANLRALRCAGARLGDSVRSHRAATGLTEAGPAGGSTGRLARFAAGPGRDRTRAVVETRHRTANAPAVLPTVPARGSQRILLHLVCPIPSGDEGTELASGGGIRVLAAARRSVRRVARRLGLRLDPATDGELADRAAGDDVRGLVSVHGNCGGGILRHGSTSRGGAP